MNSIYETKMKEEEQRKRGGRKGREGGKKRNVRIKKNEIWGIELTTL